jgi:hypothetical protein
MSLFGGVGIWRAVASRCPRGVVEVVNLVVMVVMVVVSEVGSTCREGWMCPRRTA